MRLLNRAGVVLLAVLAAISLDPRAIRAQSDRVVVLVRHAEKGAEPASDPPLTAAGQDRAAALAAALQGAGIGSVIVTPYRRTMDTAAPFAESAGLTPLTAVGTGGLEAHLEAVAEAVHERPAGEAVLVVGHSNTIPGIIAALGGPQLPDLCEGEHANLFVLILSPGRPARMIRSIYGAPDPAGAAQCR
jgi:broad specificity phosphatase PhoE